MFGFPLREFELIHVSSFESPALDVYFKWSELYKAVLTQLAPFGAMPADMRFEGNNPAAFVMACYLNDFTVALRFRISSVEFWTRDAMLAERELAPLLAALGSTAVNQALGSAPRIESQSMSIAGHFDVPGEGIRERLKRYLYAVPGERPTLSPAGVVWDGRLPQGESKVSLRLEHSLKYTEPNCAFMRVDCEYSGPNVDDAWMTARSFLHETMPRLGLSAGEPVN